MSLPLAIMILLIALIIAALAIYLIATIAELIKINKGLSSVINSVGEIVQKTAPVNGVVDAINGNLVAGRNLLENLFIKKAGSDTAGLVESLFPGEGAKFNQRVGKNYPVVNTGIVYTRGTQILASLGRGAPIGAAHAKRPGSPRPEVRHDRGSDAVPASRWRSSGTPEVAGRRQGTRRGSTRPRARLACGRVTATAPKKPAAPDMPTGTQEAYSPPPLFQSSAPPPPAPEPPAEGGGGDPGRLNVKGLRPWER